MSLDYDLYLTLPGGAARGPKLLAAFAGMRCEGSKFEGSGVTGSVHDVAPSRRRWLEETLELEADTCFAFRVSLAKKDYSEEEGYRGTKTVIDACFAVLGKVPRDAALVFNGESVVFARLANTVRLNRAKGFWDARRLAWIGVPYELEDF